MNVEQVGNVPRSSGAFPNFLPLSPPILPMHAFPDDRAQASKSHDSGRSPTPIAICGLALRLPGGIRNGDDFWKLLMSKGDARAPVPLDRYDARGFSEELGNKEFIKSQSGYFLEEDLSGLDTSFFSMTADELAKCDPQQRQILKVARECLENAGETKYRGKDIGCYVGTFAEDWLQMNARDSQHSGRYLMTGHLDFMIANRVSYEYDLHGPSQVYKTGCSASLVALHEACRALQSGDCSAALVAGTNLIIGPSTTIEMTGEGVISPNASCRPFDAGADGFARAEAINMVYIKKLDDAIKDGNPIRAVIRNTATNCAGRSGSLMQPNGLVQEQLLRKVYEGANLDPSSTAFVECHGTGTPTGDPIETRALGEVFGSHGIMIGSAKANVGHSEGASGLTSLIKAVLALEHKTIPPNIKFDIPNPKIPFEEKRLRVPVEITAWPAKRAPRISVNSFGIGGSNAHVIVDGFTDASFKAQEENAARNFGASSLIPISANTQASLQQHATKIQEYMGRNPGATTNLAYTLSVHREHMPHRLYALAKEGSLVLSSISKAPSKLPGVVMVFTGQGSQWPGMGRELLAVDESFKHDIKNMDAVLQSLKSPPEWTIENELQKPLDKSNLHRAEIAQPVCTALQMALVNALQRISVRPSAVVGHSSGEIAAAYASGALSLRTALIISFYRGLATKSQSEKGGMAAVGLGAQDIKDLLPDGVVVACENSEESTTVSGSLPALETFLTQMKSEKPDTLARKLKVDMAYHSPYMQSVGVEYLKLLEAEFLGEDIYSASMRVPLFSSVTTKTIRESQTLGPTYWVSNLTSPVLFKSAVNESILHHSNELFLEIGPHSTLAGPLRSIFSKAGHGCTYIPTMLRDKDCANTLLSAVGHLYQMGIEVDFLNLNRTGRVLTDLPTYSWDRNTGQWYEPQVSRDWRFRRFGYHSLLGLRIPGTTDLEPCWRNVLSVEEETWLQDHKVLDEPIFSFGGYCTMAREAVRQISGDESDFSLHEVVVSEAMRFTDNKSVEVRTTLRAYSQDDREVSSKSWKFVVSSHSEIGWVINCEGHIKPRQSPLAPSNLGPERLCRQVEPRSWYKALTNVGFFLGPQYPQFSSIETSGAERIARGRLLNSHSRAFSVSSLHPSVLDACLVLTTVALANGLIRNLKLPILSSVEEINITCGREEMMVSVWSTNGGLTYTVEGVANNQVVLRFGGVRFTQLTSERPKLDSSIAAQLHWHPHFDFIDPSSLFKPPVFNATVMKLREELTLLCAIDCSERIRHLEAKESHYIKYRNWFQQEILRAQKERYSILDKDAVDTLLVIPASHRRDRIHSIYENICAIWPEDAITMTVMLIWDKIERLFMSEEQALNVLFQDNLLIKVYNACAFDFSGVIKSMSHANPGLRILEVGAGTGGTTATFMESLVDARGQSGYSLYTFTDVSNGFFPQAKERFSYASNMEFKVFDISQDPFMQGFANGSYDLVIATNVVHATPCLAETLGNLHSLLDKNGRLILTELTSVMNIWSFVFGTLPGWWMGEADDRPNQPHVSIDRWDRELRAAGFTGTETILHDATPPFQYCTVIVSRPMVSTLDDAKPRKLTLISQRPDEGVSKLLKDDLTQRGYLCTSCTLEEVMPGDENIVLLLGLESPLFGEFDMKACASLQSFLHTRTSPNMLWLCHLRQLLCQDPRFAVMTGYAKSLHSEHGIPFHTLEIDPKEPEFVGLVEKVFDKIQPSAHAALLSPDRDFVVHNGIVHVGRYHPLLEYEQTAMPLANGPSKQLTMENELECASPAEESLSPTTTSSSKGSSSTPPSSLDSGPEDEDASLPRRKGVSKVPIQRSDIDRQVHSLTLDPDAAYVVVGQLDQFETSFFSWLVERGARTVLVLNATSNEETGPRVLVKDMAGLGCSLMDLTVQSSSVEDVEKAIAMAGRPIKGVIDFVNDVKGSANPGKSDDGGLALAESVLQEAHNLHTALANEPLQFFLLTTTLSTILQQHDKKSSIATTAVIEAFCQYRHTLGMPASLLDVASSSATSRHINESTVLELIELSLLDGTKPEHSDQYRDPRLGWTNRSQILLDPQSMIANSEGEHNSSSPLHHDRRLGFFLNNKTAEVENKASALTDNALSELLARARNDPTIYSPENEASNSEAALTIAHAIGMSALEFRLRQDEEVDIALTLAQMGMDSLKVIELRKWWRKVLGCEVELRELSEEKTIKELGVLAVKRICETRTG